MAAKIEVRHGPMEMVKKFFRGISPALALSLTVSTLSRITVSHTFSSLSMCNYFVCVISSVLCCVSLFPFLSAFHFFLRLALVTFIGACLFLFSSITVSFAALRLFCCFAFALVRPLRSFIRSAPRIRVRVRVSERMGVCVGGCLFHFAFSRKNFIVTAQANDGGGGALQMKKNSC